MIIQLSRKSFLFLGLLLALALFSLTPSQTAKAATCTWNGGSGIWNEPLNWSCGVVPGGGDTAIINNGSVWVSGAISISNLELNGGALSGIGTLTVLETMAWSGGTMGGGTTVIAPTATLDIFDDDKTLTGHILRNEGITNWLGGTISGESSTGYIQNEGTFDIQADLTLQGSGWFDNHGTLLRTTTDGTATIGWTLNNTDTLKVESGTLELTGGGTGAGNFIVEPGAVLDFSGGGTYTLEAGTLFSGDGTIRQSSVGALDVNESVIFGIAATFELTDGTLNISDMNTFEIRGTMNWTGGTLIGAGQTVIASMGELNINNNGLPYLSFGGGHTLYNQGMVIWSNGTIYSYQNSSANFYNEGTFNIQCDCNMEDNGGSGARNFTNTGHLNRDTTAGTVTIEWFFNNVNGTVSTESGILDFPMGGNFDDGSYFLGAGVTRMSGGTFNVNGIITAENLEFAGGALQGTASIYGTLNWRGGTMSGTGILTIMLDSTLNMPVPDFGFQRFLRQGYALVNHGTVNLDGDLYAYPNESAYIQNLGTFNLLSDKAFIEDDGGLGSRLFDNLGTLNSTSTTAWGPTIQFPFDNDGTVNVNGVQLILAGGGVSSGVFNTAAGATLTFSDGTHTLDSGVSFTGSGTIVVQAPEIPRRPTRRWVTFAESRKVLVQVPEVQEGGILDVNTAVDTPASVTFELDGGTLTGDGTLTVNGTMNWYRGTMDGTGMTDIAPGATLYISGTTPGALFQLRGGHILRNEGTTNWNYEDILSYADESATIQNVGTFYINHDLILGDAGGSGGRFFDNLGTLIRKSTAGTATIQWLFTNTGTVEVQIGTLSFTAPYFQTMGVTRLNGGNYSFGQTLKLHGGVLEGAGTVTGDVDSSDSRVSPGLSAGILDIDGSYSQSMSSVFVVEIGGTASDQFDQLTMTGSAILGGTLDVSLINGFVPQEGNSFTIAAFLISSGAFWSIDLPSLPPDRTWRITYEATAVILDVVAQSPTLYLPLVTRGAAGSEQSAVNGEQWTVNNEQSAVNSEPSAVAAARRQRR